MISKRMHAGFSLIEVLITAFIFATALMGAVAIQAVAKRSSYEAQQRTVASYLASDIIERLRLNKLWLSDTISSGTYEVTGIGVSDLTAPACSQSDGGMFNCSGSSLNQHNLYQWEQLMLGNYVNVSGSPFPVLSQPLGCIIVDSSGVVGVLISWAGRNADVNGSYVRLEQLGRIKDSKLNTLLTSVSNLTTFTSECGLSDSDRHVYGMVTMIH